LLILADYSKITEADNINFEKKFLLLGKKITRVLYVWLQLNMPDILIKLLKV